MVATGLVACTVGFAGASATALGTTQVAAPAGDGTAADAQGQHQRRHGRWHTRLQQHLGLTDDQAVQIRQIFQRTMQTAKPHHQAIRAARTDLRRLVLMEADQASIQAKEAELQQLLAQTVQMRVQTLKEITPILTPEQREKFAQLMDKRGHFGGRHRRPHSQS
ncbi:MAG: Spy/CpxP family protein refolding chaperone [Candidatus Rokuibacteriota bacterium]